MGNQNTDFFDIYLRQLDDYLSVVSPGDFQSELQTARVTCLAGIAGGRLRVDMPNSTVTMPAVKQAYDFLPDIQKTTVDALMAAKHTKHAGEAVSPLSAGTKV